MDNEKYCVKVDLYKYLIENGLQSLVFPKRRNKRGGNFAERNAMYWVWKETV